MLWTVLVASAFASPAADIRIERPMMHNSAWRITSQGKDLSPHTGFWNVFLGGAVVFGEGPRHWVGDIEVGSRKIRWFRGANLKLRSSEVWGGGSFAWRTGLSGARSEAAYPWFQSGLGWAFGTNGGKQEATLFRPFQGPSWHAEIGLELPGQKLTRGFIALRASSHLAIFNYQFGCHSNDLGCYGITGNASAFRLGLQVGLRAGRVSDPAEDLPDMIPAEDLPDVGAPPAVDPPPAVQQEPEPEPAPEAAPKAPEPDDEDGQEGHGQ